MTRILLVSPSREIVVHDIPIYDNSDVKKVQAFIKSKEGDYGELERIIISMGTVRIMERDQEIPIPLQWGGAVGLHQND
jgi:hypothetical protein